MSISISTGLLSLDIALGSGGVPRGRLAEIYGPEKCGKTALALLVVSEAQKSGGAAAFIDIDQTLDASRAARLGIDVQKLVYARPENARQAMEITRTLTRSGALALVVIDSVAGLLISGAERPENARGSSASQVLSQAVRELAVIAGETGAAVIFTNELRERAGVMYGVPVTTPGGMALKLHAAIRLEMIPREPIRSGIDILGERVQVRVVKPKFPLPFHTTFVNIMYNGEISRLDNLLDLAIELKFINKRGATYSYGDVLLGRGRESALSSLHAQPRLAEELEAAIRRQFLPSSSVFMDEGRK